MKKKITVCIAAFVLLTSLFPASVNAASESPVPTGRVVSSRFLELIAGSDRIKERTDTNERICLYPGGDVFGVRIKQDGVTVTGLSQEADLKAAKDAGIKKQDLILEVNGSKITSAADLTAKINASGGNPVTITVLRSGEKLTLTVTPSKSGEEYRLGVLIRDSAAGIGTVTFTDPSNGAFGGLGHGICDSETGDLIQMQRGEVTDVLLGGLIKGESGKPGELRGILKKDAKGVLTENSECGVFGVMNTPSDKKNAIPIALKNEVRAGEAKILCTLSDGNKQSYSVELSDIRYDAESTKCFTVRVTDPTLSAISGGIIRGMSGSPIIQDGKLVGAVTHVLIGNPEMGYGIFIENMLAAMPNMTVYRQKEAA